MQTNIVYKHRKNSAKASKDSNNKVFAYGKVTAPVMQGTKVISFEPPSKMNRTRNNLSKNGENVSDDDMENNRQSRPSHFAPALP